ncbi:MAG TPA: cell filamentation protein Fic [Lentisphaeria bacterium]|nr:MAG: cell filamentation protein Fic [Lentisphaerae bacterium GWF2_38_69]HBM17133.1 cell filamentation protein Fic [Lentisphaeria bacterium]
MFQDSKIPENTSTAGYSYLVHKYNIQAYVRYPSCVSNNYIRGNVTELDDWYIYDKRYWPGEFDIDHLVFSLKHENLDLLCLKRILAKMPVKNIEDYVNEKTTGIYARKIWFLYEWLIGNQLSITDCPKCKIINFLNEEQYFVSDGIYFKRYRLKNNILGNRLFSPIIRKTPKLKEFISLNLKEQAASKIGKVSKSLVARAASFMLLSDSKASFEIEGERVPVSRLERWGKAIAQAGKFPLTISEIIRLQNILIKDIRFIHIGLRNEGVFLGERDKDGNPLPEFIGARPYDLLMLIEGMIEASKSISSINLDPVLHAAAIAFGFVYIHPLEDGNGRIHRYLIHHILSESGFSPAGLIFPVSSSMLKHIEKYRNVLRNHSLPLLDFIEWRNTEKMNVEVTNDTSDLYSYFDCTEACEFIYSCVKETIDVDFPEELKFLMGHDKAMKRIGNMFDMPDNTIKKLIVFILQNKGTLSKKRREKEFNELSNKEVSEIEDIIKEEFA